MSKKQSSLINSEYHTAIHEAGHALVSHFMGCRIKRAEITPDHPEHRGIIIETPKKRNEISVKENRWRTEREILGNLGGHAAVVVYYDLAREFSRSVMLEHGGGHDLHNAEGMTHCLWEDDEEEAAYLKWLWIRCLNIVGGGLRLLMLEAIASALIERKSLKEREIKEFIYATADKDLADKIAQRQEREERSIIWQGMRLHKVE